MRYPMKRFLRRTSRLLREAMSLRSIDIRTSAPSRPVLRTSTRVPLSQKKPIHMTRRAPLSRKKPHNKTTNSAAEGSQEKSKLKATKKTTEGSTTSQHPPPEQPEVPKFAAEEPPLINPFPLLAHSTENIDLASRLRSYANNLGVVGALWCTLSITALTMAPLEDVYKETERVEGQMSLKSSLVPHRRRDDRKPVLVKYFGVPEFYLEDIYMASWTASFFTSAIGLGLSTVVAGLVASTAPSYIKIFVRRHSDILIAMPMCQGLSSGFAAIGLTVGLDEARGEPVSWIGYIGTLAGAALVGGATTQVLKGYKASRAAGKVQVTPPKDSSASNGVSAPKGNGPSSGTSPPKGNGPSSGTSPPKGNGPSSDTTPPKGSSSSSGS